MNERGFTLIEILVAMFVMALGFYIVVRPAFNSRHDLDNTMNQLESAIRFALDESSMRNAVIRVHFKWEENSSSYTVEYGPSDRFIMPAPKSDIVLTKDDEERQKKKQEEFNSKFHKIRELQDGDRKISDNVRLVAVGTNADQKLTSSGETSFYIFPTGEKDGVFIALGTESELATMTIEATSNNIKKDFYPIDATDNEEIQNAQNKIASDHFEKWWKE